MTTKISASILSADFGFLDTELKRAQESGCDMIHYDVMDGHFVPNISYGVPVLKSIKHCCDIPFDVHLMISNPMFYIDAFADAGADHITFHQEIDADPAAIIEKIRSRGLSAGISVKPKTAVETVFPLLDKLDMVLIMTVEPGFGGQGFISETLEKISSLRREITARGLNVDIEVDGGIDAKTAPLVNNAGANVFVSGSYLFKSKDMPAAVEILRG